MQITVLSIFLLILPLVCTIQIPFPPKIVKQPITKTIVFQTNSDRPYFIDCIAEGEPAPKYEWLKNGKLFEWHYFKDRFAQQPGRGTLVILKPSDDDAGDYQCVAKNKWGSSISNIVFFRKTELHPFKNTTPNRLNVTEGEPLKLSCEIPDGWPRPKISWLFIQADGSFQQIRNSRVSIDADGHLWFANVRMEDTSETTMVACTASSHFELTFMLGTKYLLNVLPTKLPINYAPIIQYVSRNNETVLQDGTAELFCIYGGLPNPLTLWRKNGDSIKFSDRISLENNGKSIIIKNVNPADEGLYTCEVSNGEVPASSYSIKLTVFAEPYFTEEPELVNAAEGDNVEFRCSASGVPEPEIKWIYNGELVETLNPNPRRIINRNSIFISKVTKEDIGNYACNASNTFGYVYKDVYLNVLALPPTFISNPSTTITVKGKNVRLPCEVFGVPKPKVRYTLNENIINGEKYSFLPNGDIEIRNASFEDSGDYGCIAENVFGIANLTNSLIVKERTKIQDGPTDCQVEVGLSAIFNCNPKYDISLDSLKVVWLHNDEIIDMIESSRIAQVENNSLIITNTKSLDSGKYTCVATTSLDSAEASANLTVLGTDQ